MVTLVAPESGASERLFSIHRVGGWKRPPASTTTRRQGVSFLGDDATPVEDDRVRLSAALRLIRTRRGLSVAETGQAMNMSLRTYQRFEAGRTRINIEHIHRFAKATASDPYAILMAIAIASPDHAWRVADLQFGAVFMISLQRFDQTYGDRIRDLDVHTVVAVVTAFFDQLGAAVEAATEARQWLENGADALSAGRPKPGR